MEHHHRSEIMVEVALGDSREWGAVANRPDLPDLDNRENVPEAAMPDRSDKEVYKIVAQIATQNTNTSGIPIVVVTDTRGEAIIGTQPGVVAGTSNDSGYDRGQFRWWPDLGAAPAVDSIVVDLEDDPILWEQDDLIHAALNWVDGEAAVQITLFWRHA